MIDLDYRSPRGHSMRQALANVLAKATRSDTGCLIGPYGAERYHSVKASHARLGAHVLVVLARGERIPAGHVVRHTCDVKGCLESAHLIVGTASQNVADAYDRARRTGGWARGEDRPNAVLTEALVCELRRRHRAGESLGELQQDTRVPYSPLRMAIRGETWAHVTSEPAVPGRTNQKPNPHAIRFTRRDEASEALALYDQGHSLEQIATHLNISRATAWNLCRVARQEIAS